MRNKIIAILIVTVGIIGVVEAFVYKPQPHKTTPPAIQDQPAASQTTATSSPTSTNSSMTMPTQHRNQMASRMYRDGQFTGDTIDVGYGPVQMALTINSGKITNVQFLQTPSDRETSRMIADQAKPYLKQETLTAQSANIDIVSGATATSEGYIQSLQTALARARIN